jgi:hypothetical protein
MGRKEANLPWIQWHGFAVCVMPKVVVVMIVVVVMVAVVMMLV